MRSTLLVSLLSVSIIGTALAQHEGHDMEMIYVVSNPKTLNLTADTVTPRLSMNYHTHAPSMGELTGSNQEFHAEFLLENFNVTGWPSTGVNKIYAAMSWTNAYNNQSDAIYCTLNVTMNNATDKFSCMDSFLPNISNKTQMTSDAI